MKKQITAKIISDSINAHNGVRLTTFECEIPRIILAENNTHRVFSRNASSTRAIPTKTLISQIWNDPFIPVYWGKNQAGMQAKEELTGFNLTAAKFAWKAASRIACCVAWTLSKIGMHKQIAGRVLEPFMMTKWLVTATEFDNWYNLRDHSDAQPEIQALAREMKSAQEKSVPKALHQGQWHIPYVKTEYLMIDGKHTQKYFDNYGNEISLADALKISTSCCAQVSYRKNNESLEKAIEIHNKLLYSNPKHASPCEHQATPILTDDTTIFSRNFRCWDQYRIIVEQGQE